MFDKIRRRGFALDPSCKLWMPFYRYGSEQAKIWDQSGNQKHGTISGAVPYPGNPHMSSLGSTFNRGDFTATNAFFWSSLDLSAYKGTDLGSTPYWIELIDAAGKKAIGYIGAVGAGETLGSELLANPDFTSDEPPGTAWTKESGWTITGGLGVAAAVNSSIYQFIIVVVGALGKGQYDLVSRVAGSIQLGEEGLLVDYQTVPGTYAGYRIYSTSNSNFSFYGNGFIGTIDNCHAKRVTDPPSTAVHIVSSLNGTTRDWASIESGFDPNNIASWTINSVVPKPCVGWYFDGVNDRVVHSSMNLGKLHTLHYWIKRIRNESGMVHAGAVDYNGLRISDTTVGYSSGAGTATAETHNGAPSTAIKTLISVIRILDKVTFYQNGVQIGVEQTMGGQPDDLTLTDVGRYSDGTSYFNGVVYEATVFGDNKGFIGVRNFFEMTRQIQGI